ncbi:hypothetical protein FS749_008528 [Ceratobasidium sp. UAMH 11750]|nr:hypothetical protein FS749_008528 [Ceratobasidium sp. UAMH 11750]
MYDALPEAPPPLPTTSTVPTISMPVTRTRFRFSSFETPVDSFGRFRTYVSKPLTIPDSNATLEDFTDLDLAFDAATDTPPSTSIRDAIAPCPNLSTYYLLRWFWKRSKNSIASREELVNDVLLQRQFNPSDLAGVDLRAVDKALAATASHAPQGDEMFSKANGWRVRSVPVQVPISRKTSSQHLGTSHRVMVPGLHSRTILQGIRKGFAQNNCTQFHYEPFHSSWIPPGESKSKAQTLMGEIYNSPAMIDAHKEIQKLKISDEKCTLPRVVAAVMFGSDATQLGAFSTKKAWMMYMWLGNLSKYERCKPNSGSCFDLAHIPSLPDSVKDEITKLNQQPPSASLLTHLRRELMHTVMQELLDTEFLQAWQHGIVIKCADGRTRRVFPRIFTYSADYPERVLLATIRDKGACPCPRCLVPLKLAHKMGTRSDMQMRTNKPRRDNIPRQKLIRRARDIIYTQHKAVDNAEVEDLLRPQSFVPTENAFSKRLLPFKFDFFKMFVVDVLHEIELGVWKSLLTHLIRIIYSRGSETLAEFNRRFRSVPTFSNSTIRKFSEDVASLKRLAARDLEDILQCCMPVFKGLLPESIDSQVQRLLFALAYWHGLAKLRQHTSATLKQLSEVTIRLGDELRAFQEATKDMEVFETPREYSARQRKASARAQRHHASKEAPASTTRKLCKLNLNTPKFHMVGHYVAVIAQFGTTDSFSTQTTELQHRKVKAQWFRTNMRDAILQMTNIGDVGDALDNIQRRLDKLGKGALGSNSQPSNLDRNTSDKPYHIGQSDRAEDAVNIPLWVQTHRSEPPVKFFIRLLKQHLLARITGDPDFPDLGKLSFLNDRMYAHTTLRINYTSYDVRRQHDVINTHSACRFILLPNDTTKNSSDHPFLYAKVLGIYHAKVRFCDRPPKRMDFVWVRWLEYDEEEPGGWEAGRLDRVRYGQYRNDAELLEAFDFIDPRHIVRACHLIPDFDAGYVRDSVSLTCDTKEGDWEYHTVNRFVDRDMLMRYLGGGVGHFNQRAPTEPHTTYEMENVGLEEVETEEHRYHGGDLESDDDSDNGGQVETNVGVGDDRDEVVDDAGVGITGGDESAESDDENETTDDEFDEGLYEL